MTQRKSHPLRRCLAFVVSVSIGRASCVYGTRHVDGWCIWGWGRNCSAVAQYSGCGSGRLDTSFVCRTLAAANAGRRAGDDAKVATIPRQPLKPLPPNDFQSSFRESTGQSLPLYGYNCFDQRRLQPTGNVPVTPDYKTRAGRRTVCARLGQCRHRRAHHHQPRRQTDSPAARGAITPAGVRSADAITWFALPWPATTKTFQPSVALGRLRAA